MEALHIEAMIGAMYSQTFLSNHVGIGSRGHCLDGDFLIMVWSVTGHRSLSSSLWQ